MVSAARKQQNVKAQQRFRERQKRRVEELEKSLENSFALPSNGSGEGQSHASPSPRDILSRYGFVLDNAALERIAAGRVAMEDILRAGLKAHGLIPASSSSSTIANREPRGTSHHDRILVPQNRMHAYPLSLPDIYFNLLRVKQVDTVAALRSNAELLGISFETLINQNAQSPFPSAQWSQDALNYEHIPPDLRPTPAQIQHPHSAYIDAFPFAALREQLIVMLKTEPPVVDEHDFCQDLEKGGLICWGSTVNSEKGLGAGAPWDSRSWEAQPWFLKKWEVLLGGAESVSFKNTQWWHQFRGDRLPDLW